MSFFKDGFELIEDFVPHSYFKAIQSETDKLDFGLNRGGIRNAEKQLESVRHLLDLKLLSQHAEKYLGDTPCFVRAILFNKTPSNNWLVTWHQDRTIAVSSKKVIKGWGHGASKMAVTTFNQASMF